MSASVFFRAVASAFGGALAPLDGALASEAAMSELLARHGWDAPAQTLSIVDLEPVFDVTGDLADFSAKMAQLDGADAATATQLILDAIASLRSVVTKLRALLDRPPVPSLPFPFDQAEFWQEFPLTLVHELFVSYLEREQPSVATPLLMLGVITRARVSPPDPGRLPHLRATIHWQRFASVLQPKVLIDEVFYGEVGEFLVAQFLDALGLAALVRRIRGVLLEPDEAVLDAYYGPNNPVRDEIRVVVLPLIGGKTQAGHSYGLGLTIMPIPPAGQPDAPPIGVAIGPAVHGGPQALELGPVSVSLEGGFVDDRGIQLELRPGSVSVAPSLADGVYAEFKLERGGDEAFVLLGSADGPRLQAQRFYLGLRAEGTLAGADLALELGLEDAALVFDTASEDAFTRDLVGSEEQRVGFSTGLRWSSKHGLSFRGQLGLDTHAPVNLRLGPVALDDLALRLSSDEGAVVFTAGATGSLKLGPLTVVVQELGLELRARPCPDDEPPGNFGIFELAWGVKAPSGYGLELKVSDSIHGGGFIARDPDHDRWVGAFELTIDRFGFSGLAITERDSLLGLMWFRGLKIPLFGGFITGVGLLLAHRRRSDRGAFLAALASGALEALMFPADPIAQAPALAARISALFPYDAGRTVAGVLARWVFGEAAELIVVDLGLLVEFAGTSLQKVLVVGRGKARIQDLPEDFFRINVELYGEWDLGKGELLVLASLRDSRLVGSELCGDGLLYSGPQAGFILSLGGYNPRYAAPPGLPLPRRLSARLVDTNNIKLGVELYFALTSCNVQFGVDAALWAGAGGFSIEGRFGLDALMRFDFSMIVDLEFRVALRRGSTTLASVSFTGTLEGVSPLRVDGKAKLELLFFSVCVPVSLQIGSGGAGAQPVVDALPAVRDAIAAAQAWSSAQPGTIVLAKRDRPGVWAAPEAALRMSQQVAPLDLELTHMGPSPLRAPERLSIDSVEFVGPRTPAPVEDTFSLGLYQDIDLDESIGAPLTETLESGFELLADAVAAGVAVAADASYEEVRVDAPLEGEGEGAQEMFMKVASPGARPPRAAILDEASFYRADVSAVKLGPPRYLVVDDALVADDPATVAAGLSYAKARQLLRDQDPASRRIVRKHEAFSP